MGSRAYLRAKAGSKGGDPCGDPGEKPSKDLGLFAYIKMIK